MTRDRELGQRIEVARGFFSRLRGLIGRRGWGKTDGFWIEPCSGVHAFGMRFTIDVVLVDEELRVLLVQTLKPWRVGKIDLRAYAALELPVGTAVGTGTVAGDELRFSTKKIEACERVDRGSEPLLA